MYQSNVFAQKSGEFDGAIKIGNDTADMPEEGVIRFAGEAVEVFPLVINALVWC